MSSHDNLKFLQDNILRTVRTGNVAKLRAMLTHYLNYEQIDHINQLESGCERDNLLHYAIKESCLPKVVVSLLVNEFNMNPCDQNIQGKTSFYLAAGRGYIDIMQMLKQADPKCDSIVTYCDYSPVFVAAVNDQVDTVKYLKVELGHDLNKPNKRGIRPLDLVNKRDHPQVEPYLTAQFKQLYGYTACHPKVTHQVKHSSSKRLYNQDGNIRYFMTQKKAPVKRSTISYNNVFFNNSTMYQATPTKEHVLADGASRKRQCTS